MSSPAASRSRPAAAGSPWTSVWFLLAALVIARPAIGSPTAADSGSAPRTAGLGTAAPASPADSARAILSAPGAAGTPAPAPAAGDSAAAGPAAPDHIGEVTVEGNIRTETSRIVRSFEVAPGSRYSKDALRRGLHKLFALGLFEDMWVEELPHGQAIDVRIHVRERPRLAKVEFTGNRKRETSELEKKLMLHVGEVVTPTMVQSQTDSLLRYYHAEGYAQASVDAAADTSRNTNELTLRFAIREGEKVRITRIEFEGNSAFSAKKLRHHMKTKTKSFFGGGEVKEENFTEDREKLESYYHSHGYRDARVLGHEVVAGAGPKHLTLKVRLEEGRVYQMGNVSWQGNTVVGSPVLRRIWQPKPGERYDNSRIEKTQVQAYGEYAEQGYLYVSIEPQETVRDSAVDIAFTVTEGQPSHVRLVNIIGNRNTREKVIRREIDLHEGDRFKRSALVRTQGDISRLGLFEDVQVDFTPADSTDVDINLKVKEKQVGTASAGAGYTSSTGVTGFLELGHNNVLGNGQSLSLHLERGAKVDDYELSFTEPWFRDTPTLLGFALYNTRRDLDVYSEKRVGGSARIGRPLAWPDYSHGSFSYRLENVTIEGTPTLPELQGVTLNKPTLTSSIEAFFSRNSADNPFYPTKGTRLDLDDEFAGGPFGGATNFHKHRIEGRLYFPSLLKGVTTMLRARVGLLGEYPDQSLPVPAYERFRLGGGNTLDPLRGYDDYQVVPSKFDYFIYTPRTVTSVDPTDATKTITTIVYDRTRVRYPGGNFMTTYTAEQQFPIVHPLHGVLFFDAGNTWDLGREVHLLDLKMGAGIGFRMEIPMLGNIGLDYGYGFNRDDGPRAKAHFLLGNVNF